LRKAKAEGLGMLLTEAFCGLTNALAFLGFVELVVVVLLALLLPPLLAALMEIFSLAVADSESICRFCRSSPLLLPFEFEPPDVVVDGPPLLLADMFCLILFKAASRLLLVLLLLLLLLLLPAGGDVGANLAVVFLPGLADKSSISASLAAPAAPTADVAATAA